MYQQKKKFILNFEIYFEQLSFHIGMGLSPFTRRFYEKHIDAYFYLPSSFLVHGFAIQKSFISPKRASWD